MVNLPDDERFINAGLVCFKLRKIIDLHRFGNFI